MPLPAAWVERLFARLTVRYGVAFLRQYEGMDMQIVRADWADVLGGFGPDSIAYALRYLPSDKPPTAMQFRDICRRAPAHDEPQRLEGPKPDPARVAALMERMRKATSIPPEIKHPPRYAAREGESVFAGFNPIPPESCPWNQPKGQA